MNGTDFSGYEFGGTIDWLGDYGTTSGGAAQWEYEMEFSADFSFISGGTVTIIGLGGFLQDILFFDSDLVYVCTKNP